MKTAIGITDAAADLRPNVDTNRFRRKRFTLLVKKLEDLKKSRDQIRILDVGGVISYWEGLRDLWKHLPIEITIINLDAKNIDQAPFFIRGGDARNLSLYADNSFDIVHSNSVIEHVGRWDDMVNMANEVRRLAPSYFIQTPNYWFPYEPHYRSLFFHWYPEIARAKMLLKKRRGFTERLSSLDEAMRNVQSVNILTQSQMKELFPEANIFRERVGPLVKSIVAIR